MSAQGRVVLKGVRKQFGKFTALKGIDLEIQPSEFFALLGPSGSGKTTTLRMIAGLDTPDQGSLHVDGIDMTFSPPGERDVAMVFQAYALYPHMTVRNNIAFPLKMDKVAKERIAQLVQEAAEKVQIAHLMERRPGQLSGGQQQRCALARAIVRKPKLFLLDEPLSNLDAQLRLETRVELKNLQRSLDVTTIYVTHDQEEAMTLADRMAVFMDGEIVQIGTPAEVFDRPASVRVATFIGNPPMNLLPGQLRAGKLQVGSWTIDAPANARTIEGAVIVGVRPSGLRIDPDGLQTRLLLAENLGESRLLNLRYEDGLLRLRTSERFDGAVGDAVPVGFATDAVHLFDSSSGLRLPDID